MRQPDWLVQLEGEFFGHASHDVLISGGNLIVSRSDFKKLSVELIQHLVCFSAYLCPLCRRANGVDGESNIISREKVLGEITKYNFKKFWRFSEALKGDIIQDWKHRKRITTRHTLNDQEGLNESLPSY